jgi:hypothetical protein
LLGGGVVDAPGLVLFLAGGPPGRPPPPTGNR